MWLSGMVAGTEAGCHRIVTEEAVYPSLPESLVDSLGLIFLINEISCFDANSPDIDEPSAQTFFIVLIP